MYLDLKMPAVNARRLEPAKKMGILRGLGNIKNPVFLSLDLFFLLLL